MATSKRLHIDERGNLWLKDGDGDGKTWLGPPCGEHFHDVPPELWDELEVLIGDRIDAERFALGCEATILDTWNRSRM